MSFAADDATRASAQQQASSILARIEQQKNRGQDYRLADIALLRRTCQAGGGITVDTRTVGGRDAIYKAAVDAAVRRYGQHYQVASGVSIGNLKVDILYSVRCKHM